MGRLYYSTGSEALEIPDRLLSHVMTVIATKLRRGESFTLSARYTADDTAGRTTLWIQPSIPLRFVFDDADLPATDPVLLRDLADAAHSSRGLSIDIEPDSPSAWADHARAA